MATKNKTRRLAITKADEDTEQLNLHTLLVGLQNGIVTLENFLAVSNKAKHMLNL